MWCACTDADLKFWNDYGRRQTENPRIRRTLILQNLCLLLFPSRFQAIWSLRAYEKNKNKKFILSQWWTIFGKWKGCDLIKNVGRYRKMAPFKRVRKEDFRYSIPIRIDCWNITMYYWSGLSHTYLKFHSNEHFGRKQTIRGHNDIFGSDDPMLKPTNSMV